MARSILKDGTERVSNATLRPSAATLRAIGPGARAALIACTWALASCAGAHAPPTAAAAPACAIERVSTLAPDTASAARQLVQRVESGTLHPTLVRRYGPATGCTVEAKEPSIELVESFRNGVSIRVEVQPSIEYSETRAMVRDFSEADAIAFLKLAEQDAFGHDGCGIDWRRPEKQLVEGLEPHEETTFRGTVCQCQSRISSGGRGLLVLTLRSTC